MRTKILLAAVAAAISTGAFIETAHAESDITLTLSDPSQSSLHGGELLYSGTLSAATDNTGAVFLNGLTFSFAGPYSISAEPFLANTPMSLNAGKSFTGGLFDVTVPEGAATGSFSGSVVLHGGLSFSDNTSLASANFSTRAPVAAVPEPSTWMMMLVGVVGVGVFAKRRRRSADEAMATA